jgi:hypothetical protein
MSLLQSKLTRARKEHMCDYCCKIINRRELYYRESRVDDGDFVSYAICQRCRWVIDEFEEDEDEIADIFMALQETGIFNCPRCDYAFSNGELSNDGNSCQIQCNNCEHQWSIDVSLQSLKERFNLS